jgi:outer membrane biogenesis lipoprotein LolB
MEAVMRYTTVLLAVAACALLSGCASTGNRAAIAQSRFDSDVDWEYMSQVTADAKARGYKIVWVNPPQKKRQPESN